MQVALDQKGSYCHPGCCWGLLKKNPSAELEKFAQPSPTVRHPTSTSARSEIIKNDQKWSVAARQRWWSPEAPGSANTSIHPPRHPLQWVSEYATMSKLQKQRRIFSNVKISSFERSPFENGSVVQTEQRSEQIGPKPKRFRAYHLQLQATETLNHTHRTTSLCFKRKSSESLKKFLVCSLLRAE